MTHHHVRRSRMVGVVCLALLAAITGVAYVLLRGSYALPMWAETLLLAALAVEIAHLGLSVVWVLYPPEEEDNDAVEAAFTTVAAVYTLLFGFAIVVAWQANADVQKAAGRESGAVAELDRMSNGFAPEVRSQVDESAKLYVRSVLDEWPLIDRGGSGRKSAEALGELWGVYTGMRPADRATPLYAQSIARLHEISDNRRVRMSSAESAIPPLMWFLLLGGAVLTVFLTYLFRVSNTVLQRILVTLMAVVILLALYLLAALDRPFDGKLAVPPDGFEQVLSTLR